MCRSEGVTRSKGVKKCRNWTAPGIEVIKIEGLIICSEVLK